MSAYTLSMNWDKYQESRIALALNGGDLRVEDDYVIVRIRISYPKKAFAPLITIPGVMTIGVEEGLFWILEQEGWLYSGVVEWSAKL